jgi:hypothetical protein
VRELTSKEDVRSVCPEAPLTASATARTPFAVSVLVSWSEEIDDSACEWVSPVPASNVVRAVAERAPSLTDPVLDPDWLWASRERVPT